MISCFESNATSCDRLSMGNVTCLPATQWNASLCLTAAQQFNCSYVDASANSHTVAQTWFYGNIVSLVAYCTVIVHVLACCFLRFVKKRVGLTELELAFTQNGARCLALVAGLLLLALLQASFRIAVAGMYLAGGLRIRDSSYALRSAMDNFPGVLFYLFAIVVLHIRWEGRSGGRHFLMPCIWLLLCGTVITAVSLNDTQQSEWIINVVFAVATGFLTVDFGVSLKSSLLHLHNSTLTVCWGIAAALAAFKCLLNIGFCFAGVTVNESSVAGGTEACTPFQVASIIATIAYYVVGEVAIEHCLLFSLCTYMCGMCEPSRKSASVTATHSDASKKRNNLQLQDATNDDERNYEKNNNVKKPLLGATDEGSAGSRSIIIDAQLSVAEKVMKEVTKLQPRFVNIDSHVVLGYGCTGVVYLAYVTDPACEKKTYAAKCVQLNNEVVHELVETEAKVLRAVRCAVGHLARSAEEHLLSAAGACWQSNKLYIVLELMTCNLRDAVRDGPVVPAQTVAKWLCKAADCVATLHGLKYCHRDVKSENFLLSKNNASQEVDESAVLKLGDFGSALKFGDPWTPAAMTHVAPDVRNIKAGQQVADDTLIGFDVYSLMVTCNWLLSNNLFPNLNERTMNSAKDKLQRHYDNCKQSQ